jgi:hypothetical protein
MRRLATAIGGLTIAAFALTGCGSDNSSSPADTKPAPDYRIVKQDDSGNQRTVTVEVDTTKNLKAVFDDVIPKLTDEAGYYIEINCSTGAAKAADNRLANGRKAVGSMGAATTGLDEGQTTFEKVNGATCPVK